MNTLNQIYSRIQQEEKAALRARFQEAVRLSPRLAEIDQERSELVRAAAARKITPDECTRRSRALTQEEGSILAGFGLPEDFLQLQYRCPKCRDTGFLPGEVRKPCSCRLLYREQLSGDAGINGRETFDSFSESVYRDEQQRLRTRKAREICLNYARNLPHPPKPNILLIGMPGLGKSFLGNAIAHEAISSGVDCIRVTAYRFIQDVLRDIRERTSTISRYQTVPLLVLDDLGSEPDIPNISTEWLFAVLNERAQQQAATVTISNLTLEALKARYGERVFSRLCDQSNTLCIRLSGDNLRTLV